MVTPGRPEPLRILFADDEPSLQDVMRTELPRRGHAVTVCPDGLTALAALERDEFDFVLVDLDMPGATGIEVIHRAKELYPAAETVVLTGKSSMETAIAALRHGATDYLTKPCRLAELDAILRRAAERRQTNRQIASLQRRVQRLEGVPHLIGDGPGMQQVRKLIARVAPTESTVLIRGETGTGKELVARAIHEQSFRAKSPLVAINCGALPENLIESELFGHVKGAFTGADQARTGLFQMAESGSVFLDEIGELPLAMQAKLLRVLESREIRSVGDNHTTKVDVRVICATHRDLEQMVEQGLFREDLMFRINTFEIEVPALRDRPSDIPALARHLLRRFRPDQRPDEGLITAEALEILQGHVWPGNVRELANVVEHAAILCDSLPIRPDHLPRHFSDRRLRKELRSSLPRTLREMEQQAVQQALERHSGNRTAAAAELGISVKTLYNKLQAEDERRKSA
jgi:two-component system NtrC family response regulator